MEQIVPIINAISSLILVLLLASVVIAAWIDRLARNKQISLKTLAKKAHVDFCKEFGYNSNTAISAQTAREIIEELSRGHEVSMQYLRSVDSVFNKVKP